MSRRSHLYEATSAASVLDVMGVAVAPAEDASRSIRWLKDYIFPLGSLLIGVLGLLPGNTETPRVVWYSLTGFLVLAAVVALQRPVRWVVSALMYRTRRWRARRVGQSGLDATIAAVQRRLASDVSETLLSVMRDGQRYEGARQECVAALEPEHVETLRSWAMTLAERLRSSAAPDFEAFCFGVSHLVIRYLRLASRWHESLQRAISSGNPADSDLRRLKQAWNAAREIDNTIVNEWVRCAEEVNRVAGARLCLNYRQYIPTLE